MEKQEKRRQIMKEFPDMFRQSLGFDCGDGWIDCICETIRKIREIAPGTWINQIKEKFGSLRFDATTSMSDSGESRNKVNRLIERLQDQCDKICEFCGEPGELRNVGGWDKTSCLRHFEIAEDGGNWGACREEE